MTARLIDGRRLAKAMQDDVAGQAREFAQKGRPPGLAVVLVGNDPASEIYVQTKLRRAAEAGIQAFAHRCDLLAAQDDILRLIATLNDDEAVDGILVQLPLPGHIDPVAVIEAIDPQKDVDGFHPLNVGRLAATGRGMVPCTPKGCLRLIHTVHEDLRGLDAVVVGCSNVVGRPMAQLLLAEACTVGIAHAATRNLPELCRGADILVVATGHAGLIRGDWVKRGATVIDVGISRRSDPFGKGSSIVGDVAFDEVQSVAGAITPVPGGVGPMTVACLLENTIKAATQHQ